MGHVTLIGSNLAREEHLGMELEFIVGRTRLVGVGVITFIYDAVL